MARSVRQIRWAGAAGVPSRHRQARMVPSYPVAGGSVAWAFSSGLTDGNGRHRPPGCLLLGVEVLLFRRPYTCRQDQESATNTMKTWRVS